MHVSIDPLVWRVEENGSWWRNYGFRVWIFASTVKTNELGGVHHRLALRAQPIVGARFVFDELGLIRALGALGFAESFDFVTIKIRRSFVYFDVGVFRGAAHRAKRSRDSGPANAADRRARGKARPLKIIST